MIIEPTLINKILCIKPRGIGDIVLSTIILENLTAHFTNAKIDYLTEHFAVDAVSNNPLVNKVISMDKTEFPLKVAWRIRKEKYDMIIDLWSNPRSAQITFFSGVKYRVGYSYRGRKYAYNIRGTSDKGIHHSAEHNLELLKAINVPIVSKQIHFYVREQDKLFADKYFESHKLTNVIVIGIVPAGGWASKRCDASKWIEICKSILDKYVVYFLILWGPGDEEDANKINTELNNKIKLAPKTDLLQLTGLIRKCNMVIANDSGPMHISAALGKLTLGIFGPTNPDAHRPYSTNSTFINKKNLHCIICNKLVCPYGHECMLELSVDEVIKKLEMIGKDILLRK